MQATLRRMMKLNIAPAKIVSQQSHIVYGLLIFP